MFVLFVLYFCCCDVRNGDLVLMMFCSVFVASFSVYSTAYALSRLSVIGIVVVVVFCCSVLNVFVYCV